MKHVEATIRKDRATHVTGVSSFFLKQEPGSVWEWQAVYQRSESECAQATRRRAWKCLSHFYTTRSLCELRAAKAKRNWCSVEACNLSWHVLLGELRVGAIDLSSKAIAGPLWSIYRIAPGELAYAVERPIRKHGAERLHFPVKLRMHMLRRPRESAALGKLVRRDRKVGD